MVKAVCIDNGYSKDIVVGKSYYVKTSKTKANIVFPNTGGYDIFELDGCFISITPIDVFEKYFKYIDDIRDEKIDEICG